MSSKEPEPINFLLRKVDPSRRKFLERMIIGGGAAALMALPTATLLAQEEDESAPRQGKGKGKGRGKGSTSFKGEDVPKKTKK